MKIILRVIIISLVFFIVSCRGTKKVISTPKQPRHQKTTVSKPKKEAKTPVTNNVTEYISKYKEIAKDEMRQYGIPASITLAQGILESGAGKGKLVSISRNHFGIKCHKGWKGLKVEHDDDLKGECFRKYVSDRLSFTDHSLFLVNKSRYVDLFKLPKDDYKGWAKGLKKAGYATDSKYPSKLISLIKRYELYIYDGEVLGKSKKDFDKVTDKADQHTVKKGDTLFRISKKYKISVDKLKEINGLDSNEIFVGQVLYIKSLETGY